MSAKSIAIAATCFMIFTWAVAQKIQSSRNSVDTLTETKISESRKNGKYKRTTEKFAGKVLVARKDEVSLKDNGQTDYVFVKLFRDGKMTYASTFYAAANRTVRSYHHQEQLILQEADEDGDGFFETMILFDAKGQPVEGFSKSQDGAVVHLAEDKLMQLKQAFAIFQE